MTTDADALVSDHILPGSAGRPEGRNKLSIKQILAVIGLSGAVGLVVALMALPVFALVGLTAKTGADTFLDLPTNLTIPPLPQASKMVDSQGNTIAYLRGNEDRQVVRLDQVAPVMRQAIVDIEDSRFYTHDGLDFKGLARAFLKNQEGGAVTQGGSTLTQQYVKNVLLESATTPAEKKAATEQTARRKLREARYALYLEQHLSKDQILEDYLNIAYFGDGAYGIQAAAKHYFSVNASALSLQQAATLAGLVKNPNAFDPALHPVAGKLRRDTVLDRMHELHHISDADWKTMKARPLNLKRPPQSQDSCEVSSQPFFCAYVRSLLLNDTTFGVTQADRERQLFEGGLTIHTSLDSTVQGAAQNAANSVIPPGTRVAAGVVTIQPGTGKVLAMAENRTYGPSTDKKPPQTTTDFVHTKQIMTTVPDAFSPGSTFKVFTLTAALEAGLPLDTTFNAPACYTSQYTTDTTCPGGIPNHGFRNAGDSEAGVFSMTTATWNSVNTYYIQLEQKVGVLKVADMARRLGVTSYRVQPYSSKNIRGISDGEGSVTLGTHEASTLDMATAYSTLAAHGLRCDPMAVLSITHRVGSTDRPLPYSAPAPCRQVVTAKIADTVSAVLQGVINQGTGAANAQIGRQAAGKTGTAEGFSDAWFVGYIPQLATAVTVADTRGGTRYPLTNVLGYGEVFGGDLPAKIWAATMRGSIDGLKLPVAPMPPPDNTQPSKVKVPLPDVVGQQIADAGPVVTNAGFTVEVKQVANGAPAGEVVKQTPGPSDSVEAGTKVTLFVSTGKSGGGGGPIPGLPIIGATTGAKTG